jgi:hypothetical protein
MRSPPSTDGGPTAPVGPSLFQLTSSAEEPTILGAAIEGGAEVLITGDKEPLNLGRVERLEILSPRQFWEKLKAQEKRGVGHNRQRRSR